MVCRTEVVNHITYHYCPDDLPPMADRIRGLIYGRFLDELTGLPISAQLRVASSVAGVRTRATADAVAGLIANPARRFPGLAASSVDLDMTVNCRRFVPRSFRETLGPFNTGMGDPADFPHHFAPVNLGNIELHREATGVRGRSVFDDGVSRVPLGNATIAITGVWHRFPAADVDPLAVMEAANMLSLTQGLYRQRIVGTDQVRRRVLQPQAGEEKTLLLPAAAGAAEVLLSDRVNLGAGDIVAIEVDHSDQVEYLQVLHVAGASSDTQPGMLTLAYPLRRDHRVGAAAVRVLPQAPGAANGFSRDAISGDQTLFLDALSDIDNSSVEISGSGAPEYHRARLYSVVSDGDGFFRLPPLARVAMMQLYASHAVPTNDVETIFSPDYEQYENRIDLVFS